MPALLLLLLLLLLLPEVLEVQRLLCLQLQQHLRHLFPLHRAGWRELNRSPQVSLRHTELLLCRRLLCILVARCGTETTIAAAIATCSGQHTLVTQRQRQRGRGNIQAGQSWYEVTAGPHPYHSERKVSVSAAPAGRLGRQLRQ